MLNLEEVKQNQRKIDRRVELLRDSLSYVYEKVKIVYEFHHITIYAFKDNVIAKVTVTYEALIDTNYAILIRDIKVVINASMICACTIPMNKQER